MSLTLTDVLNRINIGQSGQSEAASGAAQAAAAAKQLHVASVLNSLTAGQIISGQVKSMQGSQILLDIGNGVEVNARLDGSVQAKLGKNMLFEVKSNADDKLTLSPLLTNLSAGKSAAMGALTAANMPLTESNMEMVKSMMEEGMPIDKSSLWEMGKAVNQFPQAAADTIVRLTAMGLEINETNVAQYEVTQNMQHHLLHTMEGMTEGLQQVLSSFGEEGQPLQGLQFMKDLLQVFQGKGEVSGEMKTPEENAPGQAAAGGNATVSNEADASEPRGADALLKDIRQLIQELEGRTPEKAQEAVNAQNQSGQETAELLKEGTQVLHNKQLPEELSQRLETLQKEFTKQFKELLSQEWTIKPEAFSEKEEVKEFYQKIRQQSGAMQEIFNAAGKAETGAGQAVNQLNQNMEFMQNVNQMFPYLQIPLKASMQNAHGELYVYSRKAGKVSEDGSSSALLHLEMQYLGNLDVYVKLKDFNVSTQFTLENESVLDFLAENIHILTERLEQKGYHMDSEIRKKEDKEKEESVISRIRGTQDNDTVISYTAFDVRA